MSPEERAALKKKEIEAEFIRYKLARKAAVQRANEAGEEVLTLILFLSSNTKNNV